MNKEEDLLLKDLCARLPYNIKVRGVFLNYNKDKDKILYEECDRVLTFDKLHNLSIKPYLRPLSSMTEEEWRKMHNCCNAILMGDKRICIQKSKFGSFSELQDAYTTIDWLLEHHFDYRGLIDIGLALPAPEGMYKEE